jgi:hypothetical protein
MPRTQPAEPAAGHSTVGPRCEPRRTLVLSDAHGYPEFIEAALEHAAFDPALDRLIYAGDFIDRGPEPERCLELIEAAADVILFGNHEAELMLGAPIEFDTRSEAMQGPLLKRFREDAGTWRVAVAIGDVLVTHAGLSASYLASLGRKVTAGARVIAEAIEKQARTEIGVALEAGVVDHNRTLGSAGPLWFRPDVRFTWEIPKGLIQVAGHTPVEIANGDSSLHGVYLVDPYAYSGPPTGGRCRYGVIDTEGVRVVSVGKVWH